MAHNTVARATGRDSNQAFWAQESAPGFYAGRSELYPPERRILQLVAATCRGRPILDLGVGAGRTTAALLEISADYLGVDYSEAMIGYCRQKFPGVCFQQADVRDLGQLRERHYGLIMFSFNGLDYISHDERLRSLERLREMLARGGWFVFSSHNRLHRGPQPWALRNLKAGHLTRLPGRLWAYWEGLLAYGAIRNREYEAQDHALRIDSAFNYELVT